nr:hypothetical protein [uncultured Prevotella sp.]
MKTMEIIGIVFLALLVAGIITLIVEFKRAITVDDYGNIEKEDENNGEK